ncbi:hypothetical protein [Halorubrum sp. CBA1125]|uniref:DUF7285 family protein n=1 Tax=Halorubrum sp. CBA1125 TaxID=2668072 RepID=UPI003742857A
MSRWSGEPLADDRRAAVEPIAALAAVLAVGAALSLYAAAADDARPDRERPVAEAALDRAEATLTVGGVATRVGPPTSISDPERPSNWRRTASGGA